MESTGTSYLLNSFIEIAATITSYALTDKEKESVVDGFRQLNKRLDRFGSSSSLRQLAIESQNRRSRTARCKHEATSCSQNSARGFVKAFLVGFGVKYGLSTAPHLLTLRVLTRPSLLLRGLSRDTLSFAAFLSTLIGSYKAFLCAMRHVCGSRSSEYTNALVAGMLSGLVSAKLDRDRSRRTAIAMYLCTRALQYSCVWLFERFAARHQAVEDTARLRLMQRAHSVNVVTTIGKLREHVQQEPPSPTADAKPASKAKWPSQAIDGSAITDGPAQGGLAAWAISATRRYASTGLMAAATTVITYMLALDIDCLAPSFTNMLLKASGYDSLYPRKGRSMFRTVEHGVRNASLNGGAIPAGVPTKEYLAGFPHARDVMGALSGRIHHGHVACAMFHPHTTSCSYGLLSTFLRSFPHAMRLHLPFNAAVLVLFKSKKLRKDPVGALRDLVKSTIQSSVFYALMVNGNTNAPCLGRAVFGRDIPINYLVSGALGGFAILLERPGRRTELSMYCFLRALEALWDFGVKRGVWHNVRHGEVALFSASMAVLMAIYQNDATTLSVTYHSTLTRIFGNN
ncbi:hypothetical protein LPJ61_003168 [Coemansia biformis]|uniref:Transmembrane protein 135 N-terminal domain-containing protein n=1 Tax=Coemansia biformis TaxID=1286918 RepID=A0A9W7Y728_9FUNG|nr:hypothetical protein LPJ61_003168 [Coemansia biformis]